MLAFSDAFDMSYAIQHDLQALINQEIPLVMMTDSLLLFDIITKCTQTAGKRLLINLNSAKQAYKQREVKMIGFVRTEFNPTDCLTKVMRSKVLENILRNAKIYHRLTQWIERK